MIYKFAITCITTLFITTMAGQAYAWDHPGHMTSAAIAFCRDRARAPGPDRQNRSAHVEASRSCSLLGCRCGRQESGTYPAYVHRGRALAGRCEIHPG